MNIGLIFGGKSAEYEVSLMSAKSIYENIDKTINTVYLIGISREGRAYFYDGPIDKVADGSWIEEKSDAEVIFYSSAKKPGIYRGNENIVVFDLFFPVMHGPFGEDGKFQGLLELSNLPYVGCGVLASAITMDKELSKRIFAFMNLQQVQYISISKYDDFEKKTIEIEETISYPCFVKPANMGSTIGISKAKNRQELQLATKNAFLYDHKILVEKAVNAREIEVSVLGNIDKIEVSEVGEIISSEEFYNYEAKYKNGTSQLLIPAPLDNNTVKFIQHVAVQAYMAVGAEGLSRVDFFIDKENGEIFLNEINSMPGFTTISMYPKLWEHSGLSYTDLVIRLMDLAIERNNREKEKI